MRTGLVLGLIALGVLAGMGSAEARGWRVGISSVARIHYAAPAPAVRTAGAPRLRTAEAGGPEPMTTGTTVPAAPRQAEARQADPAPAAAPARPWCTGRVFGSGAGFCAIN